MSRTQIQTVPDISSINRSVPPEQMPSDGALNILQSISKESKEIGNTLINIQDERDRTYYTAFQNEVLKYNSEFNVSANSKTGQDAYGLSDNYENGLSKIYNSYYNNVNLNLGKELSKFYNQELNSNKLKYSVYEVGQANKDRDLQVKNLLSNLQTDTFIEPSSYEKNKATAISHVSTLPGLSEEQTISLINSSLNSLSESALKGLVEQNPVAGIQAFKDRKFNFTGDSLITANNYVNNVEKRLLADFNAARREQKINDSIEKQTVQMQISDYLREKVPVPMELMDRFKSLGASDKEFNRVLFLNDKVSNSYEDNKMINALSIDDAMKYVETLKGDELRYKDASEDLFKYIGKLNNDPVTLLQDQINTLVNVNNIPVGDAIYNSQISKGMNEAKVRFFTKDKVAEIRHQMSTADSGDSRYVIVKDIVDTFGPNYAQSALREVVKPDYVLIYSLAGKNQNIASRYMSVVGVPMSDLVADSADGKRINMELERLSKKNDNILSFLRRSDIVYGTNKYNDAIDVIGKYCAKYKKSAKDSVEELKDVFGGNIYADKEVLATSYPVSDYTYQAKSKLVNDIIRSGDFTNEQKNTLKRGSMLIIDGDRAVISNSAGVPFSVIPVGYVVDEENKLKNRPPKKLKYGAENIYQERKIESF